MSPQPLPIQPEPGLQNTVPSPATPPELDVWSVPLHGSRLLEASAGTGKTWTLSALVVRLVLGPDAPADLSAPPFATDSAIALSASPDFHRPLLPSDILVMTFTRAATRELTDRIRLRLAQAARVLRDEPDAAALCASDTFLAQLSARYADDAASADDPNPRRQQAAWRVAMAAESMDEAAIFTLDAWCQRVLREHAFDSGQPFDETLVPDEQALRRQAVQDHWRRHVYPLTPEALAALQAVCPPFRSVEALLKDMAALLHSPASLSVTPGLPPDLGQHLLAPLLAHTTALRQQALRQWQTECAPAFAALALWVTEQTTTHKAEWDGRKFAARNVQGWAQTLLDWAEGKAATDAPALTDAARSRFTPDGLEQARKPGAPPLVLPLAVAQALQHLAELDARLAAMPALGPVARAHALHHVQARLAQLKAQRSQFGFADLPQRLDAALHHPQSGDRLRQSILARYPAALIDEFQDTSPLQMRLLDRLYRVQANDPALALLLIGDPKQSIYAFRGADIQSYLQARRATAGRHHVLGTNHRSSAAMVAAVNHLLATREQAPGPGAFRMRGQGAGSHANPDGQGESPVPFLPVKAQGRPEHWVVAGQPAPALTLVHDLQLANADTHRRAYAERCAQQVVTWLANPQTGLAQPAGLQRLRPGDVAVLVRTGQEAAAVRRALARRGVASVYVSDRDSVFQSPEAADLLRWLQAVAQPRDVRLARAAWATRLADRTLPELQQLAEDDDALDARMAQLAQLHAVWRSRGVLALVRQSLFVAQWPQRWLARPDGERRLTNLLHLAELMQAAATDLDGEAALIRWLAERIAADTSEGDEPIVRLESDRHLVQIVTIHKSKGLEYPVVCLPFATLYRRGDRKLTQALRPAQGLLASEAADFSGATPQTAADAWALTLTPDDADRQLAEELRLGEDLRLLYVALTRARHALWVGFAALGAEKPDKDGQPQPPTDDTARSALGYLVAGEADDQPAAWSDGDSPWLAALQALAQRAPLVTNPSPARGGEMPGGELADPPWAMGRPVLVLEPASADWAQAAPAQLPAEAVPALHPAREVAHRFETQWAVGSFSALVRDLTRDPTRDSAHDAVRSDSLRINLPPSPLLPQPVQPAMDEFEEQNQASSLDLIDVSAIEKNNIQHRFQRGVQGGNFLHDQLEWLASEGFALASNPKLADALRQRCQQQGHAIQADALVQWLTQVCEHRLPGVDAALSQLEVPLPEMQFWLPSRELQAARVGELCRQHLLEPCAQRHGLTAWAHAVPSLPQRTLHGMVLGFADLVFAHQGRYWVLDYKSNHLGTDDAAYTPAALLQAMAHHRYDVQAALYALALHRLLKSRMGAAYQPQTHLGGAVYVFVRGLAGSAQGVCNLPMPTALLDALEEML